MEPLARQRSVNLKRYLDIPRVFDEVEDESRNLPIDLVLHQLARAGLTYVTAHRHTGGDTSRENNHLPRLPSQVRLDDLLRCSVLPRGEVSQIHDLHLRNAFGGLAVTYIDRWESVGGEPDGQRIDWQRRDVHFGGYRH